MLKAFIYMMLAGLSLSSCSTIRSLSGPAINSNKGGTEGSDYSKKEHAASPSSRMSKHAHNEGQKSLQINSGRIAGKHPDLGSLSIEDINILQFKYAVLTDVPVEVLSDLSLLHFMDTWYGTPYRYGGTSKNGIDCSAFTVNMMSSIFGLILPRTVKEQYNATERVDKTRLMLGDLVFFNTRGGISHVGIYLINNKFIHASTSSGVMISDLSEDYFSRKYLGAGRLVSR